MSSQRNAPSFSRLRDVLPSVPAAPESSTSNSAASERPDPNAHEALTEPLTEERPVERSLSALGSAADLPVRSMLPAKPGKRKAAVKTATFRMPVDLLEALRAVADYNNLNQGDIVSEGLYLHLQNFKWPLGAESEKLRDRIRHLL